MIEYAIPAKYKNLVSRSRLDLALKTTLDNAGFSGEEGVNLKLTDNKGIQNLNRQYRASDEPTDVLSFENDYINPENGIHCLGDIVISVEKAQTQADSNGNTLIQELEMLLVHGVLHLCGYDHVEHDDFVEMSSLQDSILAKIGNPLQGSIHED